MKKECHSVYKIVSEILSHGRIYNKLQCYILGLSLSLLVSLIKADDEGNFGNQQTTLRILHQNFVAKVTRKESKTVLRSSTPQQTQVYEICYEWTLKFRAV